MRNEAICTLVGRRLRWRRRSLDLTQRQVARRCAMSFQQIQKYEAGEVDVPISRLLVLAEALEMTVAELLDGITVSTDEEHRPTFHDGASVREARPV